MVGYSWWKFSFFLFATVYVTQETENQILKFSYEPPSQVIFSSSSGTVIRCAARGPPLPTITWVNQSGSIISDISGLRNVRHDGALIFPPFPADLFRRDVHSTMYRCLASNIVGTIGSREVRVRAVIALQRHLTVYDSYAIEHTTGVLRCHVATLPRELQPVITWERSDGLIISQKNQSGKYIVYPTGELHISYFTKSDAQYTYRCQARDHVTGLTYKSQRAARINIKEVQGVIFPYVVHSLSLAYVTEGESTTLPCVASGNPVPEVHWYKSDIVRTQIQKSSKYNLQPDGSLTLYNVEKRDSGLYVCEVSNTAGTEKSETSMIITAPLAAVVKITTNLQEVELGSSVTLLCEITGFPVHRLEWRHNMRPLSTNGGIRHSEERVIRLRFLTNEDEGIYQCFVANDVDSAQGSRVLMLKSVKPRFLETFREEIIYPSSDISLKCVAQGQPLPKVTWTLNKQVIPESRRIRQGDFVTEKDTVHSYVNITQAEIGDGGDFTCIAENDGGRVASTAPVKIHGPPTALPPRERTVLAGTSEHFKCPVAGYPLVNFSWKKGDDVLPSSSRHTLKDTGEFVLRAAHKSVDEGTYVCTAWGPNGHSADGVVNLRVAVAPEVDPLSFPGSLEEGRRTSLQCMVSAGDVPILIQWTKDGKPLNPTSLEIKVKSFNQYASTLFFEKLSQQHSGNYTCTASNPLATDSRTAELTVRVEPRWSVQPTDGAVVLGGQTLFDCQAEGYPQPVLRWKKSSEVKDKQTFTQVMSNAKQQVLENGSLVIVDVAPNDSGEYLCQAYNGVGPGLSKVVTLSVYVPPRFDDDFDIRMVIKGGTVTLVCQPQGDGPLTVTWVTKDQLITSSFPRYIVNHQGRDGGVISELTIHDASREDSGIFKCIASNRYGRDEMKITLVVKEPPDPPTVQLVKVLSRSVVVSLSSLYEGNSPINNYVIEIYEVNGKVEKQTRKETVRRDNKKLRIDRLKPRTTYKIQVIAENEIGHSLPSDELGFVTDGEAPQGPPRDVHVLPKGAHSLQISWKPPSPGNNSDNITGYYVGYKEMGKDDPYVFKTLQATPSFQENCTLNNLKRSTTYSIVVQAFNDKGSGPQSEAVTGQTLPQDFPPTANLRITTSTSSSIQLSWELYGRNTEAIEGYLLFMRQGNSGWKESKLSGSLTSHVMGNLRCGTKYEFYIVSYNSVGKADPSQVVTGATDGNVSEAPNRNMALVVNDSSVVVRLSAWKARGCTINHFLVKYRTADEGTWIPVSSHLPADRENVVISGLTPGTSYSVLVGVESSAGYTESQFDFMTENRNADLSYTSADTSTQDLQRTVAVITSTVCSVVVLIVILVAACTVLNRRKTNRSDASVAGSTNQRPEVPKAEIVPMAGWDKRSRPTSQREHVFVPSPYASGRFSQFSVDGDTEGCALHGSVGTTGSSGESHSYDVPLHLIHR